MNTQRRTVSWLAPAWLLLCLGAVSAQAPDLEDAERGTATFPDLQRGIEQALAQDPEVPADRILVRVDLVGNVVLQGTVPTPAARRRALSTAWSLLGVLTLEDQLSVQPNTLNDAELQVDIAETHRLDPALRDLRLEIQVDEGVATLTGSIDSLARRALLEQVLLQLRGLKALDLHVEVKGLAGVDAELEQQVQLALAVDTRFRSDGVLAFVGAGEVELVGTVRSPQERRWAMALARVPGTRRLTARRLRVNWKQAPSAPPLQAGSVRAGFSEPTARRVAEWVQARLRADPRAAGIEADVDDDGRATLSGSAPCLASIEAAQRLAASTRGVDAVTCDLVRVEAPPDEVDVAAAASAALTRDAWLWSQPLEASYELASRRLSLAGRVASEQERTRAVAVVSRLPGVGAVETSAVRIGWVAAD